MALLKKIITKCYSIWRTNIFVVDSASLRKTYLNVTAKELEMLCRLTISSSQYWMYNRMIWGALKKKMTSLRFVGGGRRSSGSSIAQNISKWLHYVGRIENNLKTENLEGIHQEPCFSKHCVWPRSIGVIWELFQNCRFLGPTW